MLRFALKDLMLSVTLIAVGFALGGFAFSDAHERLHVPVLIAAPAYLFAGGFIGAGILALFQHPWLGFGIGIIVTFYLSIIAMK